MVLILAFALESALWRTFFSSHVTKSMSLFYFAEIPYSEIVWAIGALLEEAMGILGMVFIAYLIARYSWRSDKSLIRYFSTIGFFIPWSILLSQVIQQLAYAYLENTFSGFAWPIFYFAIALPILIWLLWMLGHAISAAGEIHIWNGIAAGLVVILLWPLASSIFGWPVSMAFLVICLLYPEFKRRAS
jgi:hypothetical protein